MQKVFQKIPLLLSIIFFCISVFAWLFLFREIKNKNQELELMERRWQAEAQRRDEIKALDHSVKTIEEERAQLETHFARSSDIVPFLDTIEGLASKGGAQAEVSSVDILEDSTGLMVGMKASGTFSALYKFLTLLENAPYELQFLSMDMHRETGLDTKEIAIPKWNVVFRIKLLSFIK